MWTEGTFTIDGICFSYEAKVYIKGSEYGINGGQISKLRIEHNDEVIVQYNRGGWLLKPKTELAEKALEYVLNLYK